jgi:hypothetical protein
MAFKRHGSGVSWRQNAIAAKKQTSVTLASPVAMLTRTMTHAAVPTMPFTMRPREAAHMPHKPLSPLQHHSAPEPYCMDATAMLLELHECGIHAV